MREHPVQILLVEDNELSRAATCELLAEEGYEVTGVATGKATLEAMGSPERRFDLLVADLGLPDVAGAELVRRVRELSPTMGVVLLSGRAADDPDVSKLLGQPRVAFVRKPVDIDLLVETIEGVLQL